MGVSFRDRLSERATSLSGSTRRKILDCLQKPELKTPIAALTEQNPRSMKYIIGVDRLDYKKGILQKLDALDLFFEEHPEMVRKVMMIKLPSPAEKVFWNTAYWRRGYTNSRRDQCQIRYASLSATLLLHHSAHSKPSLNRHP
jgi:trehalose-6-phosphate synthase